jgi:hypothetical protein
MAVLLIPASHSCQPVDEGSDGRDGRYREEKNSRFLEPAADGEHGRVFHLPVPGSGTFPLVYYSSLLIPLSPHRAFTNAKIAV